MATLCWLYLWLAPMPMPAASGGIGNPTYVLLTFAMWAVMMTGMMLPSAVPVILLVARVNGRAPGGGAGRGARRTWAFVLGYVLVWAAFSVAATLLQMGLIEAGHASEMGVINSRWMAAALLTVAGIYQWLPLKDACLTQCRSPLQFLVDAYRPGIVGALRMGARHGLYCVGCCWGLMLLLFVGGVMNLLWVAALAALVFVEKLAGGGRAVRLAIGADCLLGALVVLAL